MDVPAEASVAAPSGHRLEAREGKGQVRRADLQVLRQGRRPEDHRGRVQERTRGAGPGTRRPRRSRLRSPRVARRHGFSPSAAAPPPRPQSRRPIHPFERNTRRDTTPVSADVYGVRKRAGALVPMRKTRRRRATIPQVRFKMTDAEIAGLVKDFDKDEDGTVRPAERKEKRRRRQHSPTPQTYHRRRTSSIAESPGRPIAAAPRPRRGAETESRPRRG